VSRRARLETARDRRLRRLIGFRVRELRTRAGLTQADLAGLQLSRAGVAKIEAGASLPSLATLEHLADMLGTRPRALISTDF
jgi:transcriptional regulator with XRE-family HTH domain